MKSNLEICKARNLFVKRGILNRDVISDKIIYSWVRSKLHNISFEILDDFQMKQPLDLLSINKKTSLVINYIRKTNIKNNNLYLVNYEGNLIYKSEKNSLNIPNFTNFNEKHIGTSAIGVSLITEESVRVFGCEHYNDSLVNYISESIIVEGDNEYNGTIICLISNIADFTEHKNIINRIIMDLVEEGKEETKETEIVKEKTVRAVKETVNLSEMEFKPLEVQTKEEMPVSSNLRVCKLFTLSVIEKNVITEALNYYNWNMTKTSEALGIGRSTLYRKIKEHSIKK